MMREGLSDAPVNSYEHLKQVEKIENLEIEDMHFSWRTSIWFYQVITHWMDSNRMEKTEDRLHELEVDQ